MEEFKQCKLCQRSLPISYKDSICPACQERNLFNEVREFIRSHEVNEYEVAAHFDIPIGQVKAWIKEGRIEYKENSTPSIMGVHCQRCGAPVSFGTLCPKCLKVLNGNKGYGKTYRSDNHKMRYVYQNDDSN